MIAPLRFGLMAVRTIMPKFPSLNPKKYLTNSKTNSLYTLKTFSTKYDIACNTIINTYNSYIFAGEKIFVGQKSRLPAAGKIFRGSKKGGARRKITVLKP